MVASQSYWQRAALQARSKLSCSNPRMHLRRSKSGVSGSQNRTVERPPTALTACCPVKAAILTSPSLNTADAESLTMVEERWGDAATIDKSEEVAERDGATLRLKEGGAFYAPSPLVSVAVHWPRLVAGAQSGELYHLEVQE